MSIRTKENLQTALHRELAWRKVEISRLLSSVDTTTGETRDTNLRAGIALLYAHWEGFIKSAMEFYLEYISWQSLKLGDLQSNLAALSIRSQLAQIEQSAKIEYRQKIIETIRSEKTEPANISSRMAPSTRSNLNYKVLKEIISTLGLDIKPFETKENLINETLVETRNQIAHGEYIRIDVKEFKNLKSEIITLIDIFSDQIQNAVALETFKHQSLLVQPKPSALP